MDSEVYKAKQRANPRNTPRRKVKKAQNRRMLKQHRRAKRRKQAEAKP